MVTNWPADGYGAIHFLFYRPIKGVFFTTLTGAKLTYWNKKCDQAFRAIKQYLTKPPILASPKAGDTLYLYLAVSDVSLSVALFKEDENQK